MSIIKLNANNFEGNRLISPYNSPDKVVFILFKTEWCGYCTQFKPVYEQLAKFYNGKIIFTTVDADENQELRSNINSFLYGYKILGFPTIVMYINGFFLKKYSGDRSLESMKEYINTNFTIS